MIDDHPRELQVWLFVIADAIDLIESDARGLDAVIDRLDGEGVGVFDAAEPLLLGRGDGLPVSQQAGGRVVVKRREAQDIH